MTTPNSIIYKNDEVDLSVLARKFIAAIKKRRLLFFFFCVLSISAAITYYLTRKPVYKSTFIADVHKTTFKYIELAIISLNELVESKSHIIIAQRLNIDENVAQLIEKIDISLPQTQENQNNSNATFKIDLLTRDTVKINEIHEGIISYLKNGEFLTNNVQNHTKIFKELNSLVSKEIAEMDSLKGLYYTSLKEGRNMNISNVGTMNESAVNLYEKKLHLENDIKLLNELQVVQNFLVYNDPYESKSIIATLIVFLIVFIIGIGTIIILELDSFKNI